MGAVDNGGMRDPRKLELFHRADELVFDMYKATQAFPIEERFGLQSQLRRAAVSVVANIVEGCARPATKDYLRFVVIAIGSASEARYLVSLAARLSFLDENESRRIADGYTNVIRPLQSLVATLEEREAQRRPRGRRGPRSDAS